MTDLNLAITITADGRQVQATVNGVTTDLAKLGQQGERAGQQMARGFGPSLQQAFQATGVRLLNLVGNVFSLRNAIVTLTGAGGIGLLVKNALNTADAIAKASDRIGIGIERLQELQFAAKLSGVELGEFENAMRFLGRNAADAAEGTGEAIAAFEKLGVSVQNADGSLRPLDDILLEIADRFATVTDAGERTQIVMDLMSRGGAAMIPFLQGGADAIEELARQAREAGVVMDEGLVRKAERAADQIEALGASMRTNFQIGLLTSIVDAFDDMNGAITDPAFQQGLREWGEITGDMLRYAVENADTILTIFATVWGTSIGARIGRAPGAAIGGGLAFLGALELTGQTDIIGFVEDQLVSMGLAAEGSADRVARLQDEIAALQQTISSRESSGGRAQFGLGSLQTELDAKQAELSQALSQLDTERRLAEFGIVPPRSGGGGGLLAPPPSAAGDEAEDLGEDPRIAAKAAIEAYIQALRDEQTALALNSTEREVARAVMQAQQIAMDAGLLLTEEQAEAIRNVTRENIAAADAEAQWNDDKARGEQLTEALRTPLEAYNAELREMILLEREGHITQATLNRWIEQAKETLEDADEATERWQEGMRDLGSVVSTQFEDAVLNGAKLRDVFKALEQDIVRIITRLTFTKPLENFFIGLADGFDFGGGGSGGVGHHPTSGGGGIFDFIGGIFSSIFHDGGIAGDPAPQRLVPAGAFAGAQRLHSGGFAGTRGFATDEVPAILKRGESVFPTAGVLRGSLGGTIVNIIDQRGRESSPVQQRRSRTPDGRELVEILIPAMRDAFASGGMDGTMRETYGLARSGR